VRSSFSVFFAPSAPGTNTLGHFKQFAVIGGATRSTESSEHEPGTQCRQRGQNYARVDGPSQRRQLPEAVVSSSNQDMLRPKSSSTSCAGRAASEQIIERERTCPVAGSRGYPPTEKWGRFGPALSSTLSSEFAASFMNVESQRINPFLSPLQDENNGLNHTAHLVHFNHHLGRDQAESPSTSG